MTNAITYSGELINKIGTSQIAQNASSFNIPLYSAAEIYKYDPATLWGNAEGIEIRGREEVLKEWKSPPKKLKIFNPAFDRTRAKYISAYITDIGLVPPQSLAGMLSKTFNMQNPM